jgi:hypothetical protein
MIAIQRRLHRLPCKHARCKIDHVVAARPRVLRRASRWIIGFMGVGFVTNLIIGVAAYIALKFLCPKMRGVDQATIAGYYGSESAGMLCLFLLEMGMTASRKLKDLKSGGPGFIAFGLIAPNLFATFGIAVAHTYSYLIVRQFKIGSYGLFAVLCAAASYIAVPAVQRLAIPEASPTLPLAASLGLTFSYNVTIGIPIYIVVAQQIMRAFPVA